MVKKKKKKKEEDNSRTGYGMGQYPFVLYNRTVLTHKTMMKLLIFVFSFNLNNKLNDLIVRSLLEESLVFNDSHSRGQILYGSKTSNTFHPKLVGKGKRQEI